MSTGKVKFFNAEKGFGFIKRDGDNDLFFHISELDGHQEPQEDDVVEFELGEGRKGPCATNVRLKKG